MIKSDKALFRVNCKVNCLHIGIQRLFFVSICLTSSGISIPETFAGLGIKNVSEQLEMKNTCLYFSLFFLSWLGLVNHIACLLCLSSAAVAPVYSIFISNCTLFKLENQTSELQNFQLSCKKPVLVRKKFTFVSDVSRLEGCPI